MDVLSTRAAELLPVVIKSEEKDRLLGMMIASEFVEAIAVVVKCGAVAGARVILQPPDRPPEVVEKALGDLFGKLGVAVRCYPVRLNGEKLGWRMLFTLRKEGTPSYQVMPGVSIDDPAQHGLPGVA